MNRIQQLAKTAIEAAADDDLALAKKIAAETVAADVALQRELVAWAIEMAIDAEWRSGRSARWHRQQREHQPEVGFTPEPSQALRDGLRLTVDATKTRLMDYEMEPGKRLCDSTKPEILRTAERLEKQADTMKVRSAWLKAVAAMLPNNQQVVKAVLREADLTRLQRRVMRQNEAA